LLVVDGDVLVRQGRGVAMLMFDLANVAKALVQFEQSSDASQEAIVQLV
jgi:hypothetical protein